MKRFTGMLLTVAAMAVVTSCADPKDRYVDLSTGKTVEMIKDDQSGLMVNAETKKPVRIYVDTKTNDTIWGKTGVVINGSIMKGDGGVFVYTKDEDANTSTGVAEDGDYKKKVSKDGDIKIKDGDTKIKIDGETGAKKVKKD